MQKVSLETFAEHFEKLNCAASNHGNNEESNHDIDLSRISEHNFELNSEITEEEVLKCLSKLTLNKACSSDMILNKFLKFSKTKMLTAFTKFFLILFSHQALFPMNGRRVSFPPYTKTRMIKQILTIIGALPF